MAKLTPIYIQLHISTKNNYLAKDRATAYVTNSNRSSSLTQTHYYFYTRISTTLSPHQHVGTLMSIYTLLILLLLIRFFSLFSSSHIHVYIHSDPFHIPGSFPMKDSPLFSCSFNPHKSFSNNTHKCTHVFMIFFFLLYMYLNFLCPKKYKSIKYFNVREK